MLALPLTASAEWLVGGGYANFSDDSDGVDISLGAVYGAIAYNFVQKDSHFSIIPELRIGTGMSDDKIMGVNIEIESFTALSVRGQMNYENGVYIFAMPSYANLDMKASAFGQSASEDSWEFGFGAGVGMKLNEKAKIETSYESYDGTDVLTIGFKYSF